MTKEEKTNKFIHVGMVSSYLQLIEGKGYGEIIELQKKHKVKNVFFLPPKESNGCKNSYWIYGIRLRDKKEKSTFQAYLNKNNIGNRDYFYPLHKQPALKGINFNTHGECKNTTLLSETGLYIPSGLGITYDQQSFVIKTILNFYR